VEIAGVEMVYATDDAMKCVLSATNLQNTEFVRTGITSAIGGGKHVASLFSRWGWEHSTSIGGNGVI